PDGVPPSHQGFDTDDGLAPGPHHGLVVDLELAVGQGPAQVELEVEAGQAAALEVVAEDLETAAAPGLGPVHGHVALPDAFLRPEVRAVADDHAGRGGDDELPLAERERLGEAGEEPLDDAR